MFRSALLKAALVLLGVAIGVTIDRPHADGLKLEFGAGSSNATRAEEGTWWQDQFEHHLQLKSRSYSIGVSGETPLKDLRWAARYVNLGQFSTRAIANADDNDNAQLRGSVSSDPNRGECKTTFAADCQYDWHGEGNISGFLATLGAEPFKAGPIHFGIEAGAYLYKATWRERVMPTGCGDTCWAMQIDKRTGWQFGPEIGLTARWGYVYAALRAFDAPKNITAGYSGPILDFSINTAIPFSL
jgi:hypothetical protein